MSKSPAFQFYADDFISGTVDMTAEEVGGYIRLICYQWAKGGVPDNDKKIIGITRCRRNAIASIREKFEIKKDDKIFNKRLEEIRQKQIDNSNKQSANAMNRWGKQDATALPTDMPNVSQTDALHTPYSSISLSKEKDIDISLKKVKKKMEKNLPEHKLQTWIKEHCQYICKMPNQLTFEEAVKIEKKYDPVFIAGMLKKMNNHKSIEKNKFVYLTLLTWIRNEINRDPTLKIYKN